MSFFDMYGYSLVLEKQADLATINRVSNRLAGYHSDLAMAMAIPKRKSITPKK